MRRVSGGKVAALSSEGYGTGISGKVEGLGIDLEALLINYRNSGKASRERDVQN